MEHDLTSYRELNPDRPPDWRWQRCILLETKNVKTKEFDDKITLQVRKYLKAKKQGITSEQLCNKFPVLYEVDRIYTASSTVRWTLEALIMANLKPSEIAERFGWGKQGKKIIEMYERVRFDVRPRLKFDSFILSSVLGQVLSGNIVPSDEKIWKMLAWVGGRREMGSALLDGYLNIEHMTSEVKRWYDSFIDNQFTRKTIRALFKFDPVNTPQIMEIMKMYNDNRRIDIERTVNNLNKGEDDTGNEYAQLVKKTLSITVANVNKVADSSIEPRAMNIFNRGEIEAQLATQVSDYQQKMLESRNNKQPEKKKADE